MSAIREPFIPPRTRAELVSPAPPGQRHEQMKKIAVPLIGNGLTAEAVFALIARLHRDYRLTSLIVTHNLAFARRCTRVLRLDRGRLEEVAPESLMAG